MIARVSSNLNKLSLNHKNENGTNRFVQLMLHHMAEIAQCAQETLAKAKRLGARVTVLEKGLWYGEDYYEALKRFKQQSRLDYFVNKHLFYHGFTNNQHLRTTRDLESPFQKKVNCFETKEGHSFYEALDVFYDSLTLMDCSQSINLAIYFTLKDLLGKEKLDELNSLVGLKIASEFFWAYCLFDLIVVKNQDAIQDGDLCTVRNLFCYLLKHPLGSASCYNTIATKKGEKFFGFGLPADGVTLQQLEEILLTQMNQHRVDDEMVKPEIWAHLCEKNEVSEVEMTSRNAK